MFYIMYYFVYYIIKYVEFIIYQFFKFLQHFLRYSQLFSTQKYWQYLSNLNQAESYILLITGFQITIKWNRKQTRLLV